MTDSTFHAPQSEAGTVAQAEVAQGEGKSNGVRPVTVTERISSIDVLRGFALLGILLMNIGFALPHWNPIAVGDSTALNVAAWTVNGVLFEGTMRAIFSMLFGAGVVLLTHRAEARGGQATIADIYYRRVLWLVLFGVIHAYVLLWHFDILYWYGLVGLFLFPLRKWSPKALLMAGALALAVFVPKSVLSYQEQQTLRAEAAKADAVAAAGETLTEEQKEAQKKWAKKLKASEPDPKKIQKKIEKRRSGYWANFTKSVPLNIKGESKEFYLWGFWDSAGMMLLGMGLLKLRVFSATRSIRFYVVMAAVGYGIGLPRRGYWVYEALTHNFDLVHYLDSSLHFWSNEAIGQASRLCVALGHVAVIMLICRAGRCQWLTSRLAAVGRMALSNYIMHTIICTLLFYGFGFGLYARLERYELYYVVATVWIVQLISSPIWLRYFRFGPFEWVWRSLTYWKRQPLLTR